MLNQAENCSYVSNMIEMKDCYDCEFGGEGEFGIENIETFPMPYRAIGTINCYVGNDVYYSFNCMGSKDILGCACLKKFQYCLLNKQYSEENYLKIKEKVISHMRKTGEWGEFLPIKYSLFGYNETNAIDYFPLSKEEIRSQNWPWYEFIRKKEASTAVYQNIKQCFKCLKSFKLIPQEIEFYKIQKLPEPKNCYQCRYAERLLWRNQNKLYHRECVKCRKEIFSTYSPKRTEKIFCIECYNKKIY
jgi:Zn ribbon nucleic-acid-binding protein